MNGPLDIDKAIQEFEAASRECTRIRQPVDGTHLRAVMGRKLWQPAQHWGCCGWAMASRPRGSSVIVTADHVTDAVDWLHASVAHRDHMPTYQELTQLRDGVFGDGWAYQVFAPRAEHINLNAYALHLFGRADGTRVLPDFGRLGTI